MEIFFIILTIVLLAVFFFFTRKDMSRRALLKGSFLKQSEDNDKITDQARTEDANLQHQRLMGNKRYQMLYGYVEAEVKRIKAMGLDEAKKNIPHGTSEKIIQVNDQKIVISLNADFPAIKVNVYPKRFLGSLMGAEEWVYLK